MPGFVDAWASRLPRANRPPWANRLSGAVFSSGVGPLPSSPWAGRHSGLADASQVTQKYCDNVISKCTKILSHYFFEVFDNVTMLNIAETLLQHFFEI